MQLLYLRTEKKSVGYATKKICMMKLLQRQSTRSAQETLKQHVKVSNQNSACPTLDMWDEKKRKLRALKNLYLMCSCNLLEVRNVCDGPDGKSSVYQSIVDKHVRHTEHCDPKALQKQIKTSVTSTTAKTTETSLTYSLTIGQTTGGPVSNQTSP